MWIVQPRSAVLIYFLGRNIPGYVCIKQRIQEYNSHRICILKGICLPKTVYSKSIMCVFYVCEPFALADCYFVEKGFKYV